MASGLTACPGACQRTVSACPFFPVRCVGGCITLVCLHVFDKLDDFLLQIFQFIEGCPYFTLYFVILLYWIIYFYSNITYIQTSRFFFISSRNKYESHMCSLRGSGLCGWENRGLHNCGWPWSLQNSAAEVYQLPSGALVGSSHRDLCAQARAGLPEGAPVWFLRQAWGEHPGQMVTTPPT